MQTSDEGLISQRSVAQTLEDLSHGRLSGAGGWAAAHTGALAAALVAMVAHAERQGWAEAGGAIAQADALRQRLCRLADRDADAYVHARDLVTKTIERYRPANDPSHQQERRDHELAGALRDAAQVPLAIAETAADVAALAAWAAHDAGDAHRPDAIIAASLAQAACDAAAQLVHVNLAVRPHHPLAARANAATRAAHHSRHHAHHSH